MSAMASQITRLTIVYSTVYTGADQRKYQSSASLAFVKGINRGPVNSPHKGPITRKRFPFDDVIMLWGSSQRANDTGHVSMSMYNWSCCNLKFMDHPAINSIFLPYVTIDAMKTIVLSLKNGAAGWDDITPQILKIIHHSTNNPLVYMSNLSLRQDIFPNELKIANVLPLFKACDLCVIIQCLYYVYICIYIYYERFMRRSCIIAY